MGMSLSKKSWFRVVQIIRLTLMDCNMDGKQRHLVLLMPKFRNMFSHHIYLLLQFDHVLEIIHWDPTTISPNANFSYPKAPVPFLSHQEACDN